MSIPNERRGEVAVAEVMVDPVLIPSSVELDPLLAMLRAGGLQMGIVVDEWGNFDGIVTLEDLVEELVGDVRDEYDPRDDSIRPEGKNVWNVSGLLRPDEVATRIGITLPEDEEYETLGGLIGLRLERVPHAGDTIEVEAAETDDDRDGVRLTVLNMEGFRVGRIRLQRIPRPPLGDEEQR